MELQKFSSDGANKSLLLRLHDYRYNENPPEHVRYFDADWINNFLKFLVQNSGELSKRAKEKELNALSDSEIDEIQKKFQTIFLD